MIAYIYYPLRERLTADLLRDLMIEDWPEARISILIDKLVDDHPLPHFHCKLPEHDADTFINWLEPRKGTLSIRIDVTGTKPRWLGRKL
ncbi:DOPA 4,5-dioxygenase family protein [Gynuella sp.]|uniref:DOPA 4,5-dioxygenase family protein n=1 Tax=Gynuella sp. TaxID=2969146 RepID=UPI003D14448E